MEFRFENEADYIEAWEYMLRINEGFKYNRDKRIIEINPIDHDQLPIYDEEVVKRLTGICGNCGDVDSLLAKEIRNKNVAG